MRKRQSEARVLRAQNHQNPWLWWLYEARVSHAQNRQNPWLWRLNL
jgi:hypothetical protein